MIDDPTLERGLRARPPADPPYRSRIAETPPAQVGPRLAGVRHTQPGSTRSMRTAIRLMAVVVLLSAGMAAALLSTGGRQTEVPSPASTPHASVAPSPGEAERLLRGVIEARIAGQGAEEYGLDASTVPLLYATSTGRRYERGGFEQVLGKAWPYGRSAYKVRLSAGDTVVEQLLFWDAGGPPVLRYDPNGYATEIAPTTEDGQPVASEHQFFDGAVRLQAAHPWVMAGDGAVPFGRLVPDGTDVPPTTDGGERRDWDRVVLMADPPWVGTDCTSGPQPGDAEEHARTLVESIRSDPGLEATPPIPVSVGGYEGLMLDVRIAPGASICANANEGGDLDARSGVLSPVFDPSASSVHHETDTGYVVTGIATGDWMRLYVLDVPATSGMLAIAIVAPETDFERATSAALPLVDSIEIRP